MSDQVETAPTSAVDPDDEGHVGLDPAVPERPHTALVQSSSGGLIGIMHLGEKVRSFMGDSEARIHSLFSKVGVGEFGLSQADADDLATQTVSTHQDMASQPDADDYADLKSVHAALQDDHNALQAKLDAANAECERLQAENARLSEALQQQQTGQTTQVEQGDPQTNEQQQAEGEQQAQHQTEQAANPAEGLAAADARAAEGGEAGDLAEAEAKTDEALAEERHTAHQDPGAQAEA